MMMSRNAANPMVFSFSGIKITAKPGKIKRIRIDFRKIGMVYLLFKS
jgi:hypothetical protein